jgi:hypothetical protein
MQIFLIGDEEYLYRKVTELHFDPAKGKINSSAFYGDELSVDWAKFTTPEDSLKRPPVGKCLAKLQAQFPRKLEQEVRHDPLSSNYSHSLIVGDKRKQSVRRYLRDHSEIMLASM